MEYKVGDKVLFNGEIKTISKVVLGLDENYVMFKGIDDDVFELDDLEIYKSAHDLLIEDGWKEVDNKIYEKYDEQTRMLMGIMICNDKYGKYISFSHYTFVDLKLSRILTQYLEEME